MFENVEWGTIFTALGVVLSLVLPGIGSAIGVARAGQAAAGVVAEQPENFFKCMIVQPVSYTHLDVYKRQGP